jgi:hypothetical protein
VGFVMNQARGRERERERERHCDFKEIKNLQVFEVFERKLKVEVCKRNFVSGFETNW